MARKVKDNNLGNMTVREALPIRGKPYWRGIEQELSIGYRRLRNRSGTWTSRHYVGGGAYAYAVIGPADDRSDPDNLTVFSFDQAVAKARERHTERAKQKAGIVANPSHLHDQSILRAVGLLAASLLHIAAKAR